MKRHGCPASPMAFSVKIVNTVPVKGEVKIGKYQVVPDIGAGAAYASGDAMGFQFEVDTAGIDNGWIVGMLVTDMDKESLGFDLLLFSDFITQTANNDPFDLADGDRDKYRGSVSITAVDYVAFNDNSAGQVLGLNLPFDKRTTKRLVGQCVTRGAPNWTAATDLAVALLIVPA